MHMEKSDILHNLAQAVIDMDMARACKMAAEAISCKIDPYEAITDGLARGMDKVNELFENEEYFVPEILLCWHEIAHLLTLDCPTEMQPVHRSTSEHSAVERLMDQIAADIGFFDPLFAPVFRAKVHSPGRLDFAAINLVRQQYAAEASFQATAIACLKRWPTPGVYLEAGLALTAAEARQFDQESIPARRPTPKLRVLKVIGNEAARAAGLRLVRNLQVPKESILHRLFFSRESIPPGAAMLNAEDLGQWRRSNGNRLSPCPVSVEARLMHRGTRALRWRR